MPDSKELPFIMLSAIMDATAKPAELTQHHAQAYEHAMQATRGKPIAGLDLTELAVAPQSFAALRKQLQLSETTVAVYDVFGVSSHVNPHVRNVAGQYLAAQILWMLDQQNLLSSVPLSLKLDVPKGWPSTKDAVSSKLNDAGALTLSPKEAETFKDIKSAWDSLRNAIASGS